MTIGRQVDYWRLWWEHQVNDDYWQGFRHRPEKVHVPIFQQGAWFDPYSGSHLRSFGAIGDRVPNRVLVGPWSHEEEVETFRGDIDLSPALTVIRDHELVFYDRFGAMDDVSRRMLKPELAYVPAARILDWPHDQRLAKWDAARFAGQRAWNETMRKLVVSLDAQDAGLLVGTDTGNPFVVAGFAVHDELALFVAAGLTPIVPFVRRHRTSRAFLVAPGVPGPLQ